MLKCRRGPIFQVMYFVNYQCVERRHSLWLAKPERMIQQQDVGLFGAAVGRKQVALIEERTPLFGAVEPVNRDFLY